MKVCMEENWNTFIQKRLAGRIGEEDTLEIAYLAQGAMNNPVKEVLYALVFDSDNRVAENAAWIFAHFDRTNNAWLYDRHDALIDEAMRTPRIPKRRMLLSLLLRQPFSRETIRTDFLDFCLERMMAAAEPVGIRAYCMKLAYLQCRFFPELLCELRQALEIMEPEYLSPGLKVVRRNLLKEMATRKNNKTAVSE